MDTIRYDILYSRCECECTKMKKSKCEWKKPQPIRMVEKTWWNLKIIKNDIAQKQHGIIKCDRNVWNVLHVWKKTHTHTCTHMYWNTFEPSGRRHENACKITERKNGNKATARATVNNNTTSTTVAAAAGRACSWFCICICCKYVCLCAIADGRTFDICVEYALVYGELVCKRAVKNPNPSIDILPMEFRRHSLFLEFFTLFSANAVIFWNRFYLWAERFRIFFSRSCMILDFLFFIYL